VELSNSSPVAGCCNLALRTGHIAVLSVLLGDIPGADFWRIPVGNSFADFLDRENGRRLIYDRRSLYFKPLVATESQERREDGEFI